MSIINERTWRETKLKLAPQTCSPYYFHDTKPNHILITNRSNTVVYLSLSSGVCKENYSMKIQPRVRKLFPRPRHMSQVYLYQDSDQEIVIDLESWEGEFEPTSLNQAIDTIPLSPDEKLGIVEIENFPDVQNVNVENFPVKQNVEIVGTSTVHVENFPLTQQVEIMNAKELTTVTVANLQPIQKVQDVTKNIIAFNNANINITLQPNEYFALPAVDVSDYQSISFALTDNVDGVEFKVDAYWDLKTDIDKTDFFTPVFQSKKASGGNVKVLSTHVTFVITNVDPEKAGKLPPIQLHGIKRG